MGFDQPKMPIVIDEVLPDPSVVRDLLIRGAPYWTVQRYVKNLSEMTSLSDAGKRGRRDRPMFIAPWFRGDWAYDEPLVEGTEIFLWHEGFREAAQQMFHAAVVIPQIVYVNLNPPIATVDPGHVDIPAFRGIDRTRYPVWLLVTMLRSGLFDRWHIPSVTAVAWYYEGEGGGFTYWPNGTIDQVIDTFLGDLKSKGTPIPIPTAPLEDRAFIDILNAAYRRAPTVFE